MDDVRRLIHGLHVARVTRLASHQYVFDRLRRSVYDNLSYSAIVPRKSALYALSGGLAAQ